MFDLFSLDEKLNKAASEVIAAWKASNQEHPLNDLVKMAREESGFNPEQTRRLVEKVNSEAFLAVFPEKHAFEVADSTIILGEAPKYGGDVELPVLATDVAKQAALAVFDEMTKEASIDIGTGDPESQAYLQEVFKDSGFGNEYMAKLAATPYTDIFGCSQEDIDRTKQATTDATFNQRVQEEETRRMIEAPIEAGSVKVAMLRKQANVEMLEDQVWEIFKEAALGGTPVAKMESDLINSYPDQAVMVVECVNALVEKLATMEANPRWAYKRASVQHFQPDKVMVETPLTTAFAALVKASTEYIPGSIWG